MRVDNMNSKQKNKLVDRHIIVAGECRGGIKKKGFVYATFHAYFLHWQLIKCVTQRCISST